MADDVERHPPDQAQVLRRMVFPAPVGVLAELHIQHPVLAVLGGPVAPRRFGEAFQVSERAQIVTVFGRGLAAYRAEGFDPPHSGQARPVGLLLQPANVVAEKVAPDFDASVVFINGLMHRQRPFGRLGVQPQAHVFTQARMVVLERQHIVSFGTDDYYTDSGG